MDPGAVSLKSRRASTTIIRYLFYIKTRPNIYWTYTCSGSIIDEDMRP
jgi:hypothetical protein